MIVKTVLVCDISLNRRSGAHCVPTSGCPWGLMGDNVCESRRMLCLGLHLGRGPKASESVDSLGHPMYFQPRARTAMMDSSALRDL